MYTYNKSQEVSIHSVDKKSTHSIHKILSFSFSGTMIDAGTTMFIIKLGKRMPDDLSVAREAKVKTFLQFQLLIVFLY